jgi:hypothetical protein
MPKLWKCSFVGHYSGGALTVNSLHYVERLEPLEDAASAAAVADHVDQKLRAAYLACLPNSVLVDEVVAREEVRWWAPYNEIPDVGSKAVNASGGRGTGSSCLSRAAAAKISIKSNAATRGGHGWILIPAGMNAAELGANGDWASTNWDNLQALAALLDDNIAWGTLPTHTLNPIVYSETRRRRGDANYYFDVQKATAAKPMTWLRSRISVP